MTAPFRRPPSEIEFVPDLWRLIREKPRCIGPADVAAASVQLLEPPSMAHGGRELQPVDENTPNAELFDIRTYDRRIAQRRHFGEPDQTRGRTGRWT